jgi:hypothetical protein
MKADLSIKSLLTERAAQENLITGYQITATTITVHLKPKVAKMYERPDCQEPVAVEHHDREILTIQGLGLQGKALRYQVQSIRLGYLNDAGKFTTFSVPLPGIRTDVLVTDEVMDKVLYLNVDRNLPLPVVAEMLHDLYQVETSSSALDRWKSGEAAALPSVGQLIQQLNEKKP